MDGSDGLSHTIRPNLAVLSWALLFFPFLLHIFTLILTLTLTLPLPFIAIAIAIAAAIHTHPPIPPPSPPSARTLTHFYSFFSRPPLPPRDLPFSLGLDMLAYFYSRCHKSLSHQLRPQSQNQDRCHFIPIASCITPPSSQGYMMRPT